MSKKKKILVLNYEFPPIGGGGSYVSYEIGKKLVDEGHSVDVVTMSFKSLPSFEKVDGMKIYRVKSLRRKRESCQPWEQLTYIFSAKKFLKKHLKKNTYDVVHAHFIIPTGVLAIWLKKKYGLDYVVTSHGSDVLGYNDRFRLMYPFVSGPWKNIVRGAKAVTSPSLFLSEWIRELACGGKLVVIPNGIEAGKFKPMKKEKRILVVARLFENKGVQDILDALVGLDLSGWKVSIVGDGPYRSVLEKKCFENGLEKKVEFLGWVDNGSEKLKNLYGKSSIFVSASYFESFGLTVLEALQAECYVLASDNLGYKQIELEDQNYFEVGNIDELNEKLKSLLEKKTIKGRKFDKKYEWENIIKEYEKVLN